MNNLGSSTKVSRWYEELKFMDDMNDSSLWALSSRGYE